MVPKVKRRALQIFPVENPSNKQLIRFFRSLQSLDLENPLEFLLLAEEGILFALAYKGPYDEATRLLKKVQTLAARHLPSTYQYRLSEISFMADPIPKFANYHLIKPIFKKDTEIPYPSNTTFRHLMAIISHIDDGIPVYYQVFLNQNYEEDSFEIHLRIISETQPTDLVKLYNKFNFAVPTEHLRIRSPEMMHGNLRPSASEWERFVEGRPIYHGSFSGSRVKHYDIDIRKIPMLLNFPVDDTKFEFIAGRDKATKNKIKKAKENDRPIAYQSSDDWVDATEVTTETRRYLRVQADDIESIPHKQSLFEDFLDNGLIGPFEVLYSYRPHIEDPQIPTGVYIRSKNGDSEPLKRVLDQTDLTVEEYTVDVGPSLIEDWEVYRYISKSIGGNTPTAPSIYKALREFVDIQTPCLFQTIFSPHGGGDDVYFTTLRTAAPTKTPANFVGFDVDPRSVDNTGALLETRTSFEGHTNDNEYEDLYTVPDRAPELLTFLPFWEAPYEGFVPVEPRTIGPSTVIADDEFDYASPWIPDSEALPSHLHKDAEAGTLTCQECSTTYDLPSKAESGKRLKPALTCCGHDIEEAEMQQLRKPPLQKVPQPVVDALGVPRRILELTYLAIDVLRDDLDPVWEYTISESQKQFQDLLGLSRSDIEPYTTADGDEPHLLKRETAPHLLFTPTKTARSMLDESLEYDDDFGHGVGDLNENATHRYGVHRIKDLFEADPRVDTVLTYADVTSGAEWVPAQIANKFDGTPRLDVLALDEQSQPVAIAEYERDINDHESIYNDQQTMALVASSSDAEVLFIGAKRAVGHRVADKLRKEQPFFETALGDYSSSSPLRPLNRDLEDSSIEVLSAIETINHVDSLLENPSLRQQIENGQFQSFAEAFRVLSNR